MPHPQPVKLLFFWAGPHYFIKFVPLLHIYHYVVNLVHVFLKLQNLHDQEKFFKTENRAKNCKESYLQFDGLTHKIPMDRHSVTSQTLRQNFA